MIEAAPLLLALAVPAAAATAQLGAVSFETSCARAAKDGCEPHSARASRS